MRASDIEAFARQLAGSVGLRASAQPGAESRARSPDETKWVAAIAKDLQAHRGRSVVVAGDYQPPAVHALAQAINQSLGNVGTTVTYGPGSKRRRPLAAASLAELCAGDGRWPGRSCLSCSAGNPVFTAPADLKFSERLAKVGLSGLPRAATSTKPRTCATGTSPTRTARELGRFARVRRHGDAHAAAHRSALRRAFGRTKLLGAFTAQPDRRSLDIVKDYWTRAYAAGRGLDHSRCRR